MNIETADQLREIYGQPGFKAANKTLPELDPHCINFIGKSPFVVISTIDGAGNMDSSPKGGHPGFVRVRDNKTLLIHDSKGNNRVDGLINIVETGRVATLFMIPGVDETVRVNGSATITTDPEILALFSEEKNLPKTCLVIHVEEAFLHCAKAFMRAKLWAEESKIERSELPSIGKMLKDQLQHNDPVESREDMVKRYQGDL